ncbi:hypothetical protein CLI64_12550 [Nostoc sp. CENA543]|uniref:hypothetical protein n=1 Tax=Nostoc sp. CENA543 TaxID=1869241 RepID=UPI000CA1C0B9|nr:hypothetical protein [Nostoc sp. CENA543]AUT01167.1 hypothetical protein CLI64_12550 [Nostoc sp. CENA543]
MNFSRVYCQAILGDRGTGDWGLGIRDWGQGGQGGQGRIYFSTQYRLNAVPQLTALTTQHSLLSTG